MENNTTLDFQTFQKYMDGFFTSKFNQLSYSNRSYPKRMEKVTIDLSVAPENARQINVPFKSALVSRIYSTATPTTDKAGSIKIMFDYDNLMNTANAVSIFVNDSFTMDTSASSCYLTWDAQTDTSIDLYFFVDIDYRAGTTKTQIVGTVSVQNTNATSFYNKPPIPDATQFSNISANNANVYTVPANKYAVVNVSVFLRTGGAISIDVGGSAYAFPTVASAVDIGYHVGKFTILAGTVIATSGVAGTVRAHFAIEQYSV